MLSVTLTRHPVATLTLSPAVPALERSPEMNKKIAMLCLISLVGVWIILTLLGKKVEPHVALSRSFIVPFGASAWEYAMSAQVADAMNRSEVEASLGTPTEAMPSLMKKGWFSLLFQNPHDQDRALIVCIDDNDRVQSVGPITETISANGKNMRQVLEVHGVKTTDTEAGYQIEE